MNSVARGTGRFCRLGSLLATAAIGTVAIAARASAADDPSEEIRSALQARLDQLRERLAVLESSGTEARAAPAQAVTAGQFPGSWKLPGTDTSISFSGYVKADAMYTIGRPHASPGGGAGGVGDSFILSSLPVDGSVAAGQGSDFRLHARQSRLRFVTRTPTDWGELQTRIEGDFFGAAGNERFSNSDQFRIRQAFGVLGPVLAGQTQSTLMDEDSVPEVLDNFGPPGDVNIRQPQIRYTHAIEANLALDAAIENPEQTVATPSAATRNTNFVDRAPDMIGRLRYRASWGALNLSGVLRRFEYNNGRGDHDSAWGGGGHAGATLKLWDKDTFMANANYGPGLGRYIKSAAGSPDINVTCGTAPTATFVAGCGADVRVQTLYGGWGQFTHWWSNTLHSNVLYAYMHSDVDVAALGAGANNLNKNLQSATINLIWSPVSRVNIGLEGIYGWRYLARAAPGTQKSGEAGRVQLGMQYLF
jgi:hypothetical protein